jgi:hypothetical protein
MPKTRVRAASDPTQDRRELGLPYRAVDSSGEKTLPVAQRQFIHTMFSIAA